MSKMLRRGQGARVRVLQGQHGLALPLATVIVYEGVAASVKLCGRQAGCALLLSAVQACSDLHALILVSVILGRQREEVPAGTRSIRACLAQSDRRRTLSCLLCETVLGQLVRGSPWPHPIFSTFFSNCCLHWQPSSSISTA